MDGSADISGRLASQLLSKVSALPKSATRTGTSAARTMLRTVRLTFRPSRLRMGAARNEELAHLSVGFLSSKWQFQRGPDACRLPGLNPTRTGSDPLFRTSDDPQVRELSNLHIGRFEPQTDHYSVDRDCPTPQTLCVLCWSSYILQGICHRALITNSQA